MFKKSLVFTFLLIYSFVFGYSEQVVVSQFDSVLKDTSVTKKNKDNYEYFPYTYSLLNLTKKDQIKAIQSTNLSDSIDFSWTGEKNFNELWFNPGTVEYKSAIIPVDRNTGTSVKSGTFQLVEKGYLDNGEDVTSYLIKETIVLPAKTIMLSQDTTVSTGVKFTYSDTAKSSHLSAYKRQEFVIRIAKSDATDTNYDIINKSNGIKLANSSTNVNSFLEGGLNYIDFLVTGDKYDQAQNISTNAGLSLKFMPENIEVFGLPKGSYRIELYSFRYSKEVTTKGNVVITKEDNKSFTVGDTEYLAEGIDIMNFSSGDFPTIKATILTVGNTTSPSIVVSEDGAAAGAIITATTGVIYLDSTSTTEIAIAVGGTKVGSLYYQLWDVVYTTSNTAINTTERQVAYKMNGIHEARTTYKVISSSTDYSSNPNLYQTVFVTSTSNSYGNGTYEIDDRIMDKYSNGYRRIRKLEETSSGIETLYKGISGGESMTFNTSYNWTGTTNRKSFVISKVISDSKGTFREVGNTSNGFTFYTTTWTPAIDYKEKLETTHTDTANFSWTSPNKTSYDTSISEDKVIFRILKSGTDSATYRYKPEDNSNSIRSSDLDLTAFLSSTNPTPYFDVIFGSGEDGKLAIGDVVFNFSKNNTLQIVGLTAGDYKLQIYSLQNEDTVAKADTTYDYRVLTYGGDSDVFTMGLPILETGDFKNQNNIYLIDSISVNSYLDSNRNPKKDVEVGIIIKAEETIASLMANTNLVAQKDEVSTSNAILNLYTDNKVTEMWDNDSSTTVGGIYNNIKPVESPVLSKADKANFQYPLDIIFLIDNSGSMQNEINSVKDGLDEFTSMLTAKGYDVKFNLITFGPAQNAKYWDNGAWKYPTGDWHDKVNDNTINNGYLAIYKSDWFNYTTGSTFIEQKANELSQLKDAFSNINALYGYKDGQENGAWAIHHGIDKLKTNERYLNRDFQIINRSSNSSDNYLPSKKWIILLTDENMDTDSFPTRTDSGTAYNSSNVVTELSSQLSSNDITFTGIYHTKVVTQNQTTLNNYLVLPGSSYSTQTWWSWWGEQKQYTINILDKLSHNGEIPADTGNTFYSQFALQGLGSKFNMYEMGATGQYVAAALKDSISNIGIIQRWNLNYTSPFPENDGKDREVIFSLKGLRKISSVSTSGTITYSDLDIASAVQNGSRIYNVPERKVLAYFINPNGAELEKTSSGIILEAKAQSQYTDPETGMKVNYPITKGTFIISGNYSNDGTTIGTFVTKVVSSDDTNNERVKLTNYDDAGIPTWWWNAKSTITNEEFKRLFGKNPINAKITFIAETVEESYSISQAVTIVDKVDPIITSFKMTNVTLRDFMSGLKDSSSTPIFDVTDNDVIAKYSSTSEATTDGAITVGSFTDDKKLNVKDGDNVSFEFDVDDENITASSTGVAINYGGTTYSAINVAEPSYDGTTKTKWKVENSGLLFNNETENIVINITDNSVSPNTLTLSPTVFNQPNLLANTTLKAPTLTERYTGDASKEYYNTSSLTVNEITDALAYLIVFDYDKSVADIGATTEPLTNGYSGTVGNKRWLSSRTGTFNFYNGQHGYNGTVYVMNSAGAIWRVTHDGTVGSPSGNLLIASLGGVTIGNVIENITITPNDFYIDTVSPVISDLIFRKDSDPNLLDTNLLNNNSTASGILIGTISNDRPYKSGDTISLNATISEVNFFKSVLSPTNIIATASVTAGGIAATSIDGTTGLEEISSTSAPFVYEKGGTAVDLTSGTASGTSPSITITVYDKAGNSSTQTFAAYYDDSVPNNISVAGSSRTNSGGVTYKYTNNISLPLKDRTGTNYSVGMLTSGAQNYIGDIRGTGTINLTSFSTNGGSAYNPVENVNNLFNLISFSKSGMEGANSADGVVLDTEINDARTSITETNYTNTSGTYVVNLTNTLSTITELIGLSSYRIAADFTGAKLSDGTSTNNINSAGVTVNLTNPTDNYYINETATTYTSVNNILLSSSGRKSFKLTLTDRLGNTKTINYIVEIPNSVNIIGKKINSNFTVNTKIDNSTKKMEIKARK